MGGIQDVTGTAFIVAEFRNWQNEAPEPLYADPVVPVFLNAETRAAAKAIVAGFPSAGRGVQLRTRYLDDHLDAELEGGCKQVLILGAGLDTRAVRKHPPSVAYFEIDDEAMLGFKAARLAEAGFGVPATYIAGNYVRDGLIGMLTAHGFDFAAPTFVIWEGNTMYLTKEAVLGVIGDLRERLASFVLSLDYVSEGVIAGTTGDAKTTRFVQNFADMGAPWGFGTDDIDALAREAGMAVADKVKVADLHRAFWPGLPMEGLFFEHYSLATLRRA